MSPDACTAPIRHMHVSARTVLHPVYIGTVVHGHSPVRPQTSVCPSADVRLSVRGRAAVRSRTSVRPDTDVRTGEYFKLSLEQLRTSRSEGILYTPSASTLTLCKRICKRGSPLWPHDYDESITDKIPYKLDVVSKGLCWKCK